jgi:uncharacterized protein Yka (UPF0111/DUF47 family)
MAKRLFKWFAPRRGEKVIEMVEEHLKLTQNAVSDLYRMVEASASRQMKDCEDFFESVSQLEMKADNLRKEMVEELTRSEMFPEERDDLMELVRAVDWIADWSKEAGRILVIIPFDKAPDEMKEAAQNMCREVLEEELDELYSAARVHLANLEFPDVTTGALILLNMFLDALETVADWCENTADIVRAIAVRVQ